MNALLNAQGLSVTFGGLKAVDGLDISIREGHIHALIGPNGAGKSTVVNALSGFVKPTAGSLTISGSEVCGREAHVIAQAGLARTFQNIRLFGAMSVLETVLVGAHRHFDANLWHLLFLRRALRVHEAQMVEQAKALLRFVGLDESFDERAPPPLPTAISAG
ncbi:ATP-binding cassette domain-containing protein [Pseudomonas aeruginosa]|nr:ATP-binding cassette domain-containing protein [Pseudomonas aeruginosa]